MPQKNIFCYLSRLIIVLIVFFSFNTYADFTLIQAPDPADPMRASIYRLDNGLMVYLTENPESPRFYAEIAVRAGSKQDPAESTGLAHYLEHLLFKGSENYGTKDYEAEKPWLDKIEALYEEHFYEADPEKRKAIYAKINEASVEAAKYAIPNELDRLYKAMGGQAVNAHTWHEETVYKVNLPNNRLEQWAALEAERFLRPVFRGFQTELEIVYEEMNRALDNKNRIISYAVEGQLYKTHPYGQQPTLGLVEHLKNPSLKNIGIYYDTWYVPNNMAIFISGDINTEEAIQTIARHFGVFKPKDIPEPQTWEEAPLQGREYVETTYVGEEFVLLAFRTVANNHPDAEALLLLDMVLDNASAGLINLHLNQRQQVRSAGAYPMQLNEYGAQYFWGIPKDGQTLQEVEALLLAELEKLKAGDFEEWILPAIINDFKKREKSGLEDNYSRVSAMRSSWLRFEEWPHATAQIARMEKLTKDDIVRVANTYFGGDHVAGYRINAPHTVPDIEKPELAKIELNDQDQSAFAQRLMAMDAGEIEPVFVKPGKDYTTHSVRRGVKLYHAPNPLNDLFQFAITIEKGSHHDNTLGMAANLLDKSGTERLSPEELKKEWYKLGTDFSVAVGENSTSIVLSGLDENFEASVKLMFEVLAKPQVDAETLEELKQIILVQREDSKKQAASIANALHLYHRYGGKSPMLNILTSDEVLAMERERLFSGLAELLQFEHTIGYAGTRSPRDVEKIIKRHSPAARTLKPAPEYVNLHTARPESNQVYFVDKEGAQATVRLEFPGGTFDESLSPQVQMYNSYFAGGMSGIVFQELREARSLAYSVGAAYRTGGRPDEESIMLGVIQTQADKTPEALGAFIEIMDNLPVSGQRFAVAKEAAINNYRTGKISFRGVIGAVRAWEHLGLKPDPRASRYTRIQEQTLEDVLAFHREHIQNRAKLISIVGEKAKIDMEEIAKIGEITEIAVDDIFVK